MVMSVVTLRGRSRSWRRSKGEDPAHDHASHHRDFSFAARVERRRISSARSQLRARSRCSPGSCAPRPAWLGCGAIKENRNRPAIFLPRSMAGSPKGSTHPISHRRRRCWTNWRNDDSEARAAPFIRWDARLVKKVRPISSPPQKILRRAAPARMTRRSLARERVLINRTKSHTSRGRFNLLSQPGRAALGRSKRSTRCPCRPIASN
jgi:hypothetical protein